MKYMTDDNTGLFLNYPAVWSCSPYVGAIKHSRNKNFTSAIIITNEVFEKIINSNPHKWQGCPESLFDTNSAHRYSIRISGFEDPRKAAWLSQEINHSEYNDPCELIEDYLEMKFLGGRGDQWNELINKIPEFEGSPLTEKDLGKKYDKEAIKKASIQKKNIEEYEKRMKFNIMKEFERIEKKISEDMIDDLGISFFTISAGSPKLRDLSTIKI